MLRARSFTLLVAVTAIVVGALVVTLERDASVPEPGGLLFPGLLEQVNEVARVEVTAGGKTFELERAADGTWVAPDRGGYPLVADKVHRLLVGAAGLERVEPKTSNPERFAELGLRDPTVPEARSVGIELRDVAGESVARLIVGERRPARGDPSRSEYFVRVPGEEGSWLVRGTLPADADAVVEWLEPEIARIAEERIARVRVVHPDGETVTVQKDEPGRGSFRYLELPAGAEMSEAWRVNDLGRLLADLRLDDVMSAAGGGGGDEAVQVTLETFDGLRVRLRLSDSGDAATATLGAEYDPSLAVGGDAEGLVPAAEVEAEAARLDARWKPWRYTISKYKADTARYRSTDLVKAEQPPAAGG